MWLEKLSAETAVKGPPYLTAIMPRDGLTMSERQSHHAEPPGRREFSTEEALEIGSDRWRRVVAAFLLGAEARPHRPALRPWRGLLGGVGLTAAIVLVVGVVGVASATLAAGGAARPGPAPAVAVPSLTPSPVVSVAATPANHPGYGPTPSPNRLPPSPTTTAPR